jgi:hypothetical protein
VTDKLDRAKFARVCEMMTSSHEGERLSALSRADAMLKAAGTTWTEVLHAKPESPATYKPDFDDIMRRYGKSYNFGQTARRASGAWAPRNKRPAWSPEDFHILSVAKELEQHECVEELESEQQDFIVEMALKEGKPYTEKQKKYVLGLQKGLDRRLKTKQHKQWGT